MRVYGNARGSGPETAPPFPAHAGGRAFGIVGVRRNTGMLIPCHDLDVQADLRAAFICLARVAGMEAGRLPSY